MIGAFMGTGTGPDAVTALLGGDDSQPKAGRAITGDRRFPDRGRWHHVALVRDEKGAVRLLVDGEESRQRTSPDRFGGSFSYDQIWLGSDLASRDVVVDVDEFCLFDRALTDDELKRLGGRAK